VLDLDSVDAHSFRFGLMKLPPILTLLICLGIPVAAKALTFSEWQTANFTPAQLANTAVSGAVVDPDGDGLSNLAEYIFLGSPLTPDKGLIPRGAVADNHLTLTYRERANLTDGEVWLQASDDLIYWTTFNVLEEIGRVTTPGYADITLRDPKIFSTKRFVRLQLSLAPLPPLQPPAKLGLSLENNTQVRLRWGDPNPNETGYAVEKLDPTNQTWVRKVVLGLDTITWIDTYLWGYDGIAYRVVTIGTGGEAPSESVQPADTNNNGIPDWWEKRYFGYTGIDPAADPNGNGVSNRDEYLEGTDPTLNFYNGIAPLLTVVQGDHQAPIPGEFLRQPWKVLVRHPDGTPWSGAPVRFTATTEEGLLALEPTETAPLTPALTVNADAQGYAQVWLKCP
jgi:hypothetical protein